MRTTDLIKLAFKNVLNSRIKGLLSVISVCIGIASISLISGIGWGVASQISDELRQINTNATMIQPVNDMIDEEDVAAIKAADGIRGAMPYIFEFGTLFAKTESMDALIVGIDTDFTEIFDIKSLYGMKIGEEEAEFTGNQVIVDDILANQLYYRTNIVGKKIQIGYGQSVKEYEIVGVIESPKAGIESMIGQSLPAMVYIPYQTINEAYGQNKIAGVAITCVNNEEYDKVTGSLLRSLSFKNSGKEYKLDNISNYADMVGEITDIVAVMITCVAGISVIVGGIGIMSSMISNVENRKSEIGIYMALGINKRDILKMYMYEAVVISLAGGILGIGISLVAIYLINQSGFINVNVPTGNLILCMVSAVACGIIFGYIPAKKAAKMNPINAIRWE